MKLSNPACSKARKCQPFCGMCNLRGEQRLITDKSLFGVCRQVGKCVCKKWSLTQNCYWINGKKQGNTNGLTQDCSYNEHPHHHAVQVTGRELDEDRQAAYNESAKQTKSMYKELPGLWGGIHTWSKK